MRKKIAKGLKFLLIIIDGLGDRPIPELGNRTPLEAAKTPNLDFLAKNGISGQVESFKFDWQEKPESDTCQLALLGYDPQKYYLGRGVYEAAGIGVKLKRGDIALRTNFATINENLKLIDRRAGRIDETQPLIDSLKRIEIEGVKFLLYRSWGHRAVLVLRNKNLSSDISDSDPKKEGLEIKKVIAKSNLPAAIFTAKALNKYLLRIHQILNNHPLNLERVRKDLPPANCLLTRGAGRYKKTISFKEKYGLRACCIAGGKLYKGIGKILGMDLIGVKGANGLPDTNLKGKFLAAKKCLRNYDLIFLHIKATDNLAEDGNFLGKKDFIERIDENLKIIIAPKIRRSPLNKTLIIITGDHSTCSDLKKHCSLPSPILIAGPGIRANGVEEFNEKACQKGDLGHFEQLDLLPRVFKIAKK